MVPIGSVLADAAGENAEKIYSDGMSVTMAGIVQSCRTRVTKSNSVMAYIELEDDSGAMELIVFSRAYESGEKFVADNAPIIVHGRISLRDDKEPQLMVDSIRPIDDLAAMHPVAPPTPAIKKNAKLWLRLPEENGEEMQLVKLILTMFPGEQQMIIYCEKEKRRIGTKCLIHPSLVAELRERFGDKNVVVQ